MAKQISEFEVNDIQKATEKSNQSNAVRRSALLGVSFACALALVACDTTKDKDKTKEKEPQSESTKDQKKDGEGSVELEPVTDAKKICKNDGALSKSLKDAVKSNVSQQSKIFAAAHGQNANLALDMNSVAGRSDKILVDVKDIKVAPTGANNGMVTCQASISMTLPTADISSATKMYAANSQDSLEQRVTKTNMKLDNNMIVDDKFTFEVNPQSAIPEAKVVGQPSILQIAADVMATSALKAQIDNGIAKQKNTPVKPISQSRQSGQSQFSESQTRNQRPTNNNTTTSTPAASLTAEEKAAQRAEAARKRKARQEAARKRKALEAKKRKEAEKAAARKRKALEAKKRKEAEKAAAKKAAQKKLSLQTDGTPKTKEAAKAQAIARAKAKAKADELAKAKAAKRAAERTKTKAESKKAVAKTAPVSSDKSSKNIEMVIVEEEGTY